MWGHLASRMTGRGAVGTGHSDQRCFLMRTHLQVWFRQFWGWSVAVVGLPVVGWGGLVGWLIVTNTVWILGRAD